MHMVRLTVVLSRGASLARQLCETPRLLLHNSLRFVFSDKCIIKAEDLHRARTSPGTDQDIIRIRRWPEPPKPAQ